MGYGEWEQNNKKHLRLTLRVRKMELCKSAREFMWTNLMHLTFDSFQSGPSNMQWLLLDPRLSQLHVSQ